MAILSIIDGVSIDNETPMVTLSTSRLSNQSFRSVHGGRVYVRAFLEVSACVCL